MDILETIVTSGPGRVVTKQLGLKDPPVLRRGRIMPAGTIALSTTGASTLVKDALAQLNISTGEAVHDLADNRRKDDKGREQAPKYSSAPGALIIDASDLTKLDDLELVRQVLRPVMRGLEKSGRVIVVGPHPANAADSEARATAEALDGIVRTVGKELTGGSTANLIRVRPETRPEDLLSTLSFLISGRSAFVDGQTWEVGTGAEGTATTATSDKPFDGRIVAVTGAARGIGAAIAKTFAEAGATVVVIDLAMAGDSLAQVAVDLGGSALQLDITAEDAAERITRHITKTHGEDAKLYAIVHNAGITRDKMLANLDEKKWQQVIDINLKAEMAINEALLSQNLPGGFGNEGRIVGIASTSGIAGNKGQTNYAASKAGVIGYTDALSSELAETGITANAVAPGFIETEMTGAIPYISREIFRRVNSLSQGGQPKDVAETIAYLCDPASGAVNGQTIRVCGQNIVGK